MPGLETEVQLIKRDLDDQKKIHAKLDVAIDKLTDVSNSIHRMLAVHEERITKQEKVDELLFAKIDKLRDKMDGDHNRVLSRISGLEKKVWIGMGIVLTISLVFRAGNIFSNNKPLVNLVGFLFF